VAFQRKISGDQRRKEKILANVRWKKGVLGGSGYRGESSGGANGGKKENIINCNLKEEGDKGGGTPFLLRLFEAGKLLLGYLQRINTNPKNFAFLWGVASERGISQVQSRQRGI